jgi:hypothetical protein
MAVDKRWDSTSIFLIAWIVGIGVIATAIGIAAPSMRRSIEQQLTILVPRGSANGSPDPEQMEFIDTPNHSEVVR